MTISHSDFNIISKLYFHYIGVDVTIRKADLIKAEALYDTLRQEDLILRDILNPDQRTLGEKYKEFIRDADRLSSDQILQKYGTTIDEFRNRVSDFKEALIAGTATEPNIPRPNN